MAAPPEADSSEYSREFFDSKQVPWLKEFLKARGIQTSGKRKAELLTGRRHDGDRRFIKWTRFFLKASWLNIRRKCCKACGMGTQERYCLI